MNLIIPLRMIIRLSVLIFISFLLIETAQSATRYHIRSYLKGTANKPKLTKPQVKEFLQNEVASTLKHNSFVISNIKLNQIAARRPQHVEFEVTINIDAAPETRQAFKSMEKIQAMTIKQTDNVEPGEAVVTDASPYCLNGGFQLDDGTCVCPEEFLGDNCEYLYCFNNGVYDTEYPWQCNCPPGYNDYQCLNRNCRPQIQDDVNPPAQTLVVVLPNTVSFASKRFTILNNLAQTVSDLQAKEPGWIGYYVGVNMLSQYEGLSWEIIQSSNLTDFIGQMLVFPTFDDPSFPVTEDQDIVAGVELAYSYAYNGYPIGNSLILAFSDTANYYDKYTDYTGANIPLELVLTWRSKVFFFIIDDVSVGNRTIDVTSAGYDNLRYFSKHIHAPIFHFNETAIPQVMQSVASKLYRPQYVDVRLLTNANNMSTYIFADYYYPNDTIKITVTLDLLPGQYGSVNLYLDGVTSVQPVSIGKYFQIYEIPPSTEYVNFVKDSSALTYSAFQWTSSQDYILWGMHESINVDMGGVYTIPEKHMHIGFGPVSPNIPYYMYYAALDATNGNYVGFSTNYQSRTGCTLAWEFMGLTQCSTGTYVHQVTAYTNNGEMARVYPAFCKHALDDQDDEDSVRLKKKAIAESSGRELSRTRQVLAGACPTKGVTAFADPRYQPVRQYIFALEWADNNYDFINDLRNHINDWINSIYNINMQQMFTLIIFDQGAFNAKTITTEHSKDHFLRRINDLTIQKVEDIVHESFNGTEKYSDSLSAVILANLQTLLPRAIVHVLTQTPASIMFSGSYLILPKSIEVNYFYLADDVASYPFSVVTRQTSGRWFDTVYASSIVKNFAEESQAMELVFDEMYQLPDGMGVTAPLIVEASASVLEILVTGIYSSFELSHPNTNVTKLESSEHGYAYKVVYDVSQITDYNMQMTIYCRYCTLQVRTATQLKLYYGFTSKSNEDVNVQYEPTAWARTNGTQFNSTYIVGHVSGLARGLNETVTSLAITITQGSMSNSVFTANKAGSILVNMRPRTACGYQFVGSVDPFFISHLQYDGLKFVSTMVTSLGNVYRRIVYYYIPQDLKTVDTCNGAPVNEFGECACDDNWTGEYCQNPICQNYGYSNFGACNCDDAFSGKFCETEITNNVSDPPPTTTTWATPRTTQTTRRIATGTVPVTTTTTTTTTTQTPPPPCSSPIPIVTSTQVQVTNTPAISTNQTLTNSSSTASPGDNGNKGAAGPGEILLLTVFTLLLSYL